ncbi:hypothetical protein MCOR25_002767 [Pyricularia grisea]|uniref:Uncharacterized protein n=1 Tax=Pyricularia grisea TaxID=148305 RepID=A0A6P8AR76_PYRGI|nr:uncharacterized protein PgNI_09946 [Pyricularia grisea]KAI6376557.1 hypothetical protein MCOR25_002767 [Pyricularia grisea]TLD04626.1 hypothetical protein PgNI_09946 [Pyricularia grisea]
MLSFSQSSLFQRGRKDRKVAASNHDNEILARGGRDPRDQKSSHNMPAPPPPPDNDRPTSQHLLPDIHEDATQPFSSLFGPSFDRARVESTAQLADSSIFITSTGSRFRLERIDAEPAPKTPQQQLSASWGSSRQSELQARPAHRSTPPTVAQSLPADSPLRPPHASSPTSTTSTAAASPMHRSTVSQFTGSISGGEVFRPDSAGVDIATDGMGSLSLGEDGFGATALFTHSDGGAQAAEILTDSHSAERLATGGGYVSDLDSQPLSPPDLEFTDYARVCSTSYFGESSSSRSHEDYLTRSFTHPDSFSPPAYAPSQIPGFQPPGEKAPASARSSSLPSLMEQSSPVALGIGTPQAPTTIPTSPLSTATSVGAGSIAPLSSDPDEVGGYFYDTQTPIVVAPDDPPPPVLARSSTARSAQTPPESLNATRDNVLPGEDVLYDGAVKTAQTLAGPFETGHLKVFRNNLNHDLRFHCKVGNNTEIHWMKGIKAKMVPFYAYDQRSGNIVMIRDGDERSKRQNSIASQAAAYSSAASAIYRFDALHDLFKFQSQLTGESVVLDISSVKWIRLARANSRSVEMYSSVRLQIWHEPRTRRAAQSDVASFVTAGTALSGPLRDRTTPSSSRLMVFLGRAEEYITAFITDDVEMEPRGHTSARLKPRKYGGIHKRNSRPGIRARLEQKTGSDVASLDIHGEPYNPDVEQGFELYKTFEIEFETEPSQVNFCSAWAEVIQERRAQRERLRKIQEDMRKETFSPREALSILT